MLLFGGKDNIVKASEVGPDAQAALGYQNVVQKIYENAGHEVPISASDRIADDMWHHWTASN